MASASPAERAQAVLDFLCGSTGATRGYLFLNGAQGLYRAADSNQGPPAVELMNEAERAWQSELDVEPDANRTRTIDMPVRAKTGDSIDDQLWTSNQGVKYIRHFLGTYQSEHWTPVGIAMLEAGTKLTPLRHAYVEVVCNAFIAAGDVHQPAQAPLRP